MQKVKLTENTELTLVIFHDEFCVSSKGWNQMKKSLYVTFGFESGYENNFRQKTSINCVITVNMNYFLFTINIKGA